MHKKGNKSVIENYRPVANLCSATKIFERLILNRISKIELEVKFVMCASKAFVVVSYVLCLCWNKYFLNLKTDFINYKHFVLAEFNLIFVLETDT